MKRTLFSLITAFGIIIIAWFGFAETNAAPQGSTTLNAGQALTIRANGCALKVTKNTPALVKVKCTATSAQSEKTPNAKVVLSLGQKHTVKPNQCALVITRKKAAVVKVRCNAIVTLTHTATSTQTNTFTPTFTRTNTHTPSHTPTHTYTPSHTPVTPTDTPTNTATFPPSNTPTKTFTPSHTPTNTPAGPLPDLVIQSMSWHWQGEYPSGCVTSYLGLTVIRVRVANVGTASASTFLVTLNGAQQTVSGLGVNSNAQLEFSNSNQGQNVASADATNLIPESSEENNQGVLYPITATPAPTCTPTPTNTPTNTSTNTPTPSKTPTSPPIDLEPIAMQIELETGGSCDYQSTVLGVRVWIRNNGGWGASTFDVQVEDQIQTIHGLRYYTTTSLWFGGLAASGPYDVLVDSGNDIYEYNETNNTLSQYLPTPTLPATCTPSVTPTTALSGTPTFTPTSSSPTSTFTPSATPTSYRVVDLAVTVGDSSDPVLDGQTFNYIVLASNYGPALAQTGYFSSSLASGSGVTFTGNYTNPWGWGCLVSATAFQCSTSPMIGTGHAFSFEAIAGEVSENQQVELCVNIVPGFSPGDGHDSDMTNNQDCETTTIQAGTPNSKE